MLREYQRIDAGYREHTLGSWYYTQYVLRLVRPLTTLIPVDFRVSGVGTLLYGFTAEKGGEDVGDGGLQESLTLIEKRAGSENATS